jgi:plastocyanin
MFNVNIINLKIFYGNTPNKIFSFCSLILFSIAASLFYGGAGFIYTNDNNINYAFATAATVGETGQNQQLTQQLQPSINAQSIFETKTAVLGNNVKNLIILIPDEAHHGNGEAKEARFIEQSFLPQKAIVNKGTNVIWFSGDVSHEHKIILDGPPNSFSPSPYDSGVLTEFTASTPVTFNTVGSYAYSSPAIDPKAEQKGFVMRGDIVVADQPNKLGSNMNNAVNADTVGICMVPTKKADLYISQFKDKGLSVDSTYSFKDLRGLARGTGSEQTLVVWTAGPNMGVDNVLAALKGVMPTLPYK